MVYLKLMMKSFILKEKKRINKKQNFIWTFENLYSVILSMRMTLRVGIVRANQPK